MKPNAKIIEKTPRREIVEGQDCYFENGLMVLTAHFLLARGYCCENNCRHCPYAKSDLPKNNTGKLQHKIG